MIRYNRIFYKRSSKGAIQYWHVTVVLHEDNTATIRKESGRLNTVNPIIHDDHITVGKNLGKTSETSPLEQAVFQAISNVKKKKDEGYKSLGNLGIQDHGDYVSKDGQDLSLAEMLEIALPKSNTDASGNVKPMLATDWEKVKKIEFPSFVQPKLDGVRCLLVVREGKVNFFSRSGKPYTTLGHIADRIEQHPNFQDADVIMDGEVYAHTDVMSFQELTSAVKKLTDLSALLMFRIYDIVEDLPQWERLQLVEDVVITLNNPYIVYVGHEEVESKEEVLELHDKYIKDGYEGAMIRYKDATYKHSRSRELLKVKVFDETEFAFKNFEFGKRGVEDLIAVCWDSSGAQEFRAKMEGNLAHKKKLYAADVPEGVSLTVKHFGLTDGGIPRFPIGKTFRNYE